MQVVANLAGQRGRLLNEIAAMACPQLQIPIRRFQLQLAQPKAGDRRTMSRVEIGLIGFVARIGGHPILLGREGMDDPRFKAGVGEGPLQRQEIVPCSFDDHDDRLGCRAVPEAVESSPSPLRSWPLGVGLFGVRSADSQSTGHHPLRAMLGGIDADNGELFTADLLDVRANDAILFPYCRATAGLRLRFFPARASNVVRHLKSPDGGTVKRADLNKSPITIQPAR